MGQELYIKIEVKAEIFLLRPLDIFVRNLVKQLPAFSSDQDTVDSIELAFNEAYANISRHAYKSGVKGPVQIEIFVKDRMLEIRLEDNGENFNPTEVKEPDFQNLGESGLGIWLMKQFMDDLVYESGECGQNVLRLIKRIPDEKMSWSVGCS
ncbi:MAG: ATP-binding protein [Desulfomonile sp.]